MMKMMLNTVKSEGLAHNSYYLASNGEAVVIDPRRDCEIYTELASKDCTKIKYILETHRNEDYVVGSLELQNMTGAQIGHSKELPFRYGENNLADGDTLNLGNLKIKVIYTPGHTNESVCYLVFEREEAKMVFTGDTLFSGSVGRVDLYGRDKWAAQAEDLYSCLQERLLKLDGGVLVYPAHGAGSICGGEITGIEPTTIGYEKITNPYLRLSKKEFVKKSMSERLAVPRYFKQIEEYNLNGPPLLCKPNYPEPLPLSEFEDEMQQQNIIVVDTRRPNAFAGSHIPNSLSMWLGGTSVYPGWLMDPSQRVIFVHEKAEDNSTAAVRFYRLGFDNIIGYLCGGIDAWQEAGKPFQNFCTINVTELRDKMEKKQISLLDVRDPREWSQDGYIAGAKLISFYELPEKSQSISKETPLAVTCSVGNRSSIALSILERAGFKGTSNVLGGMIAWKKLRYPTKKTVD